MTTPNWDILSLTPKDFASKHASGERNSKVHQFLVTCDSSCLSMAELLSMPRDELMSWRRIGIGTLDALDEILWPMGLHLRQFQSFAERLARRSEDLGAIIADMKRSSQGPETSIIPSAGPIEHPAIHMTFNRVTGFLSIHGELPAALRRTTRDDFIVSVLQDGPVYSDVSQAGKTALDLAIKAILESRAKYEEHAPS